jgi:ribonuclease HI
LRLSRDEAAAAIAIIEHGNFENSLHALGPLMRVVERPDQCWKERGWRTAQGRPVLNPELWKSLEAAVARHEDVHWIWIRGHNGHVLNERADRMASEEALAQRLLKE